MSHRYPPVHYYRSASVPNSPGNVVTEDFKVLGGGSFSAPAVGLATANASVANYAAFLLDMDGVLQRCGVAVEGAAEFLKTLDDRGLPYVLLTNEDRVRQREGEPLLLIIVSL